MAECHQETGYFPIDSLPLEVIELIRAQCDPATLLSWSSTCHFYRGLLRLHVFEQITIGPKIPPTRVVEALSGNFHVLSLEFTCEADRHSHQAKEDSKAGGNVGGQRSPKDLISSEMLGQVLRQFPEDLANLTLRFPEKWIAKDNLCWPREFAFEEEQPLTDIERNNLHNDLLWTTLDSMAKNNISSQRVFRLQLLNISPHVSGVYHQPCFRNFLRKITSFVLELCRFERHWRHRPLERTWYRYLLSGWFYDQLQRVEDFSFFATPIWSDTLLSDSRHVYSTLSPKAEQLPNLKHLTLSTVMIDPNLIAFLTSKCHAQNIESISLHDCFCHATIHDYGTPLGDAEYDASECPTWATLFDRLVAQRPPNLTSFTISYGPWQLEEKMACYYQEGHETKHCSLASTMNPQMYYVIPLHFTDDRVILALDILSASMNLTNAGLWRQRALFSRMVGRKATEKVLVPPDSPLAAPALKDHSLCFSYEVARGEMGVLSFEPYKGLILPYWAFRTVPVAEKSAEILWTIFESYVERGDLVGADMTRKFIQMGMTRARRYANHKGGRKYGEDGKQLEKWTEDDVDGKRKEKEEASEVFKAYWRRCIASEAYVQLKKDWSKAKKEYLEARG